MKSPDGNGFGLFRSIYGPVISSNCSCSTLQILPDAPDGEVLSHESTDGGVQDIALSKKTYLAIFAEGHAYFERAGYKNHQFEELPVPKIWDLYYATSSILLTVNEHFAALRLHQNAFIELLRRGEITVRQELDFATFLVTSKLKRVNKSSVLFHWIRRLFVALFGDANATKTLVQRLLRSLQMHFANYCAGYTLQWLIRVLRAGKDDISLQYIGQELKAMCMAHLGDVTLWRAYSLCFDGEDTDTFAVEQFNEELEFWRHLNIEKTPLKIPANNYNVSPVFDDLRWLLKVECVYLTPYECLYEATEEKKRFETEVLDHLYGLPDLKASDSADALNLQKVTFKNTLGRFLERAKRGIDTPNFA